MCHCSAQMPALSLSFPSSPIGINYHSVFLFTFSFMFIIALNTKWISLCMSWKLGDHFLSVLLIKPEHSNYFKLNTTVVDERLKECDLAFIARSRDRSGVRAAASWNSKELYQMLPGLLFCTLASPAAASFQMACLRSNIRYPRQGDTVPLMESLELFM